MMKIKKMFIEIMAKHTGQKPDKVAKDMERNKWMTPQEAKDYGLIDKIIG